MAGTAFFGKLPAFGDFVSRRTQPLVRERLDAWLADVVGAWRQSGPAFESRYDAFAPHAFALAAGVAGTLPAFGLLWSSRDRVGRRFPAVLIAPVDDDGDALRSALEAHAWYQAAQLAPEVIGAPDFDPATLEQVLDELDATLPTAANSAAPVAPLSMRARLQTGEPLVVPVAPSGVAVELARLFASTLTDATAGTVSLWPAAGAGTFAVTRGWPPAADCVRWLTSAATAPDLSRAPAQVSAAPSRADAHLPDPGPAAGNGMAVIEPQSVLLALPTVGYLCATVYADAAIDGQSLAPSLGVQLREQTQARVALQACLPPGAVVASGSAWIPAPDGGTYCWFGAAGVYRWRADRLVRLAAPASAATHTSLASLVSAPAPGADEQAVVTLVADIEDGDRILLCADGAYETLSWAQLASALQEARADDAALRLQAGWRTGDGRIPGAVVLAFDLTEAGLEATHALVTHAALQPA